MSAPPEPDDAERPGPLVDFGVLAGRVGVVALVLGALAFVAIVVEGLATGLTFGLMARWAAVFAVSLLAATAVMAATSALGGADRAQRRGERLSGRDVGLTPPRRRQPRGRDAPGD